MKQYSPRWRRYVRFWRTDVRADVDEEFEFHLRERIDDLVARGMDARSARDAALRHFGDIDGIKATCRVMAADTENRMRRSEMLAVAKQDATYALRMMRSNPAFTAAIVLTLALGIGATTSIFSVVNAVLLRPLPYADPERLTLVQETLGPDGRGGASVGHFHDWKEQTSSFSAMAAAQGRTFILSDGEPLRVFGLRVTPDFFEIQKMRPHAGRYFLPGETADSRVIVLSHPLWQTRFAGDASIVGKEITLNGERHTVVGIAPRAFSLSDSDERLWVPLTFAPEQRTNYGAHFLTVFAKLKPGVTIEQAMRDLQRVTEDIRRRQPEQMVERGVTIRSLTEVLVGDYDNQLWVLLGAVTFVLLIGCGNIASLLLARATARRKEIAIRGAIGGTRGRLVGQLLTESFVLAFAGGLLALVVAHFGVRFFIAMGPTEVPRLTEAGLQPTVVLFALGITVLCGALFGLAPAMRATRVDLQGELREGGRGSSGVVRDRTRAALIVTEIAVALVLLVSAGLFVRSAIQLQRIPLGFDPTNVTMMRVSLPADRYKEPPQVVDAFQHIVREVRAIPGVEIAAANTRVPMWGGSIDMGITVDGMTMDPNKVLLGHLRLSTPGFIEALRIPLLKGRLLQESDIAAGAPWVIVVNQTFAKTVFGNADPLGRRISGWERKEDPQWREIVGVVGDTRAFGRQNDVPPEIYIPFTQAPDGAWNAFQRQMTVVARAKPGINVAGSVRRAVNKVDPLLPIWDVQTMDDVLRQSTASRRFSTLLISMLGLTGLLLAAIGIYGVIAFFVTQRTQEIGVRIALGASTRAVTGMVVRQALSLAALGIVAGGLAAYWATQVLGTMLFQVGARDPVAYAGAAGVLLAVAIGAAWLPARRAAKVDPIKALGAA